MKKSLKNLVYKNDFLFNFYFNHIYKTKDKLSNFLDQYSKSLKDNLIFIEIGANDGMWDDPIYKFIRRDHWKGILIEPQKIAFERLRQNYTRLKDLKFENVAIDNTIGTRVLYKISFSNAQWATGISSFIKKDIIKLIEAGYVEKMARTENVKLPANKNDWISEEIVEVDTIEHIINKYALSKLDLIMIDAEGYDFEIIKSIPFNILYPTVIVFENCHFSKDTANDCNEYLRSKGYELEEDEFDTIAKMRNRSQ